MLIILILLAAGIFFGRMIRNNYYGLKLIDWITTASIYLLLFLMGISIGSNKEIVSNLSKLGTTALIITAFSLAGSILLSILVFRLFFRSANTTNHEEV